jgi:phosphate transport system protein
MADLVGGALLRATEALLAHDLSASEQVILDDERLNDLHGQITRSSMELLATQQPMAGDLRAVLAIFSIATDLERMGDHAKGIGRIGLRLGVMPWERSEVRLAELADLVRVLLLDVVDAFVRRDPDAARNAAGRDDEVDEMYRVVYTDLIRTMEAAPAAVGPGEGMLWVAKSLERCGDHVTNIAEWVVFMATGDLVELNQ